jgi:hypothetical protein
MSIYSVRLHLSERALEDCAAGSFVPPADAWAQDLTAALVVARAAPGIAGATIWEGDVMVAVWTPGVTDRGVAYYFHGRAPS